MVIDESDLYQKRVATVVAVQVNDSNILKIKQLIEEGKLGSKSKIIIREDSLEVFVSDADPDADEGKKGGVASHLDWIVFNDEFMGIYSTIDFIDLFVRKD